MGRCRLWEEGMRSWGGFGDIGEMTVVALGMGGGRGDTGGTEVTEVGMGTWGWEWRWNIGTLGWVGGH